MILTDDKNEKKKPRIAIISNAVAFPYGTATTAHWSLFKEYFANKDCYANTHGYDLIIDSRCSVCRRCYVHDWWFGLYGVTSAAVQQEQTTAEHAVNEMRRDSKAIQQV